MLCPRSPRHASHASHSIFRWLRWILSNRLSDAIDGLRFSPHCFRWTFSECMLNSFITTPFQVFYFISFTLLFLSFDIDLAYMSIIYIIIDFICFISFSTRRHAYITYSLPAKPPHRVIIKRPLAVPRTFCTTNFCVYDYHNIARLFLMRHILDLFFR